MTIRHQEVIDRIEHMYLDIEGNINFPNSYDGDVLKIAYRNAKETLYPQLDDNQQIVLDWLKEKMTKESRGRGFEFALWWLLDDFGTDELSNPTTTLFGRMNDKQRKEVLSAFIAWALEQEAVNEK